jgi:hypothetical protein
MTREDAIAAIAEIRSTYVRDRSVFVEGHRMAEIVRAFGATEQDLKQLAQVSEGLSGDPTLPFRKTKNGRFCIDSHNRRVIRLEFKPFVLSEEEDFVRHDSGIVREFDEIGDDLQGNVAFHALFIAKSLIIEGVEVEPRPHLDYSSPNWVCTLFNIRTVTNGEMIGEPALEGVHSDGVDHTMTTFLGAENMTADSAVTRLHDMQETNGRRWNEAEERFVVGQLAHRSFLDTMLIVDHERKHSVTPVTAVDKVRPATRDMLIFFTRKPAAPGHVSYPFDSLQPHPDLPLSINLRMS